MILEVLPNRTSLSLDYGIRYPPPPTVAMGQSSSRNLSDGASPASEPRTEYLLPVLEAVNEPWDLQTVLSLGNSTFNDRESHERDSGQSVETADQLGDDTSHPRRRFGGFYSYVNIEDEFDEPDLTTLSAVAAHKSSFPVALLFPRSLSLEAKHERMDLLLFTSKLMLTNFI